MMTVLGVLLVYNTLNGNLLKAVEEGAHWVSDKLPKAKDEK